MDEDMKANLVEFTRVTDPLDSDFSRLRGQDVAGKLLRRYPDYASNLQRAHERLKSDPNYAPAMHRAAESVAGLSRREFPRSKLPRSRFSERIGSPESPG
jgi:hypothetical protein